MAVSGWKWLWLGVVRTGGEWSKRVGGCAVLQVSHLRNSIFRQINKLVPRQLNE
jgi:hypothetical protein